MSALREKMLKANIPPSNPSEDIKKVTENRDYMQSAAPETATQKEVKKSVQKQTTPRETKNNDHEPTVQLNTPYKAVCLIPEYHIFLRVRPKQLGYTKETYLDMIIMEEIDRVKKIKKEDLEQHHLQLYHLCDKRFKEVKERSALRFSQKALDFIEDEITNSGVTFTAYMNYLIEKELNRESKYGKRPKNPHKQ